MEAGGWKEGGRSAHGALRNPGRNSVNWNESISQRRNEGGLWSVVEKLKMSSGNGNGNGNCSGFEYDNECSMCWV